MNLIALVMIARNESRCIERSLKTVQPWVDDMVVLDTGSTDRTVELAQACGARVFHFDWVDDFSAARNAALALTSAHWRLVMDADEWLESGAEVFQSLRTQPPNFIGQVTIRSFFDQGITGVEQSSARLSRILPAGVQYEGRVHEQPVSHLPHRRLPLVLGHDGYLPEPMKTKAGRNQSLLRLSLESTPDDAYLQYQLAKDLEIHGLFEQAAPWYDKAYAAAGRQVPWRHDLVLRRLFTLKKIGDVERAVILCQEELPHWQHSPDFYFTMGDVFLDCALHDSTRVHELLPMIEFCWQRAIEIGDTPDLPDSVMGRGSFLAAHNLAVFHEALGHTAEARKWQEKSATMRSSLS